MKKPVLLFTCADSNNFEYARMMLNSLTKFHSPKDVDILLVTNERDKTKLASLPQGIGLEDLDNYLKDDPIFFYRQKPILMEKYLEEYEVVIGLDSDQIVLNDLSSLWSMHGYDVATVINWNRADPQVYGYVEGWGIQPPEYFNCGLVALRSQKFAHHWKVLCFSKQFERLKYREQDLMNILCYYGNYNVRCLDIGDPIRQTNSWWGIISKGEYIRAELRGKDVVIPKGFGDTPFPPTDMILRVIHAGGGNMPNKMNYRMWFQDEAIIKHIDTLVKGDK